MVHKNLKPAFYFLFFFLGCSAARVQTTHYTVQNAHSHNDYVNPHPFVLAFEQGFGSIEADIFLRNNELLVAHNKKEIKSENTLRKLYLDPLAAALKANPSRKLNLLIDLKDNYKKVLPVLVEQLRELEPLCSSGNKKGNLTILISGSRPSPAEYNNYPAFIFFDDDLALPHTPEEWKRVGLVSLNFTKYSKWEGKSELPAGDKAALIKVISETHSKGKPIRFWAAPDTEKAWKAQMDIHADYIGTDKIKELADFLN
jgi:alkaline phosphatase